MSDAVRGTASADAVSRLPTPMTDESPPRMRVECTECDFAETLTRSEEEWAADAVEDHAERTGHRLRSVPIAD